MMRMIRNVIINNIMYQDVLCPGYSPVVDNALFEDDVPRFNNVRKCPFSPLYHTAQLHRFSIRLEQRGLKTM